jgi:cleavage and polyadenylation specificity factor subunit 1
VDLLGPLTASKGFTYLFTIIDRTSRWPEAIPINATTTVDCTNALFEVWVSRCGVPAVITSDSGAQFTSSLWAALCSLLDIQHN